MTALPKKHYSDRHKTAEEEDDRQHLEKRSGKGNVDSRLQVQLEEDGDGSTTAQGSWMETSGLCLMIHREPKSVSM